MTEKEKKQGKERNEERKKDINWQATEWHPMKGKSNQNKFEENKNIFLRNSNMESQQNKK
jgi:hypothetical protein